MRLNCLHTEISGSFYEFIGHAAAECSMLVQNTTTRPFSLPHVHYTSPEFYLFQNRACGTTFEIRMDIPPMDGDGRDPSNQLKKGEAKPLALNECIERKAAEAPNQTTRKGNCDRERQKAQ